MEPIHMTSSKFQEFATQGPVPPGDYQLPPNARKALYTVQWAVNGILTVAGAFFAATGQADTLPSWYVVALAVGPVLWTYLGVTAASNTDTDPGD